jgi:hypothetical protein
MADPATSPEGVDTVDDRRAGRASYQDPLISIQDGTLTIRRYYFPTGAKRIRLEAITGVEEYAMTKGTGKLRIWGRATSSTRFSRDPGRRRKQHAFVIDVGRTAKPVVTPDDPDAFRAALTMAGVPISTAARRGAGQRS